MDCKAYLTALLTKDNQFGLQGLEVNYVESTSEHSQGNQQHGRADTEQNKQSNQFDGKYSSIFKFSLRLK